MSPIVCRSSIIESVRFWSYKERPCLYESYLKMCYVWVCVCSPSYRYLVNLGCIKPLCDLLTVMDSKIVQVALNGLENILRLGEQEAKQENNGTGVNPYCSLIEEAYGKVYPY